MGRYARTGQPIEYLLTYIITPLPIKLPYVPIASPGFKPKGRVCEERMLRRSQAGQCSDVGIGDLGALPTHETSPCLG